MDKELLEAIGQLMDQKLEPIQADIAGLKDGQAKLEVGQIKLEAGQVKLEDAVKVVDRKVEVYANEILRDVGMLEDRLKKIEPVDMNF